MLQPIRKMPALALACLTLFAACTDSDQPAQTGELQATWQFKQANTDKWMPATVPGNVHTDLLANKVIADPFYGTNEDSLQWIEHQDWLYAGEFVVDAETLKNQHIELEFAGLDTYADVKLNGHALFSSDNMFVAFGAEVKPYLLEGKNRLEVLFRSPIATTMPLHQAASYTYPADNDRSAEHLSVYSRKAPYHFGWDWGPRFVTSGIWRPVRLKTWNDARFTDVHLVQNSLTDEKAELTVNYQVESATDAKAEVMLAVGDGLQTSQTFDLKPGLNVVSVGVEVKNPKRWWPNGMGEATLYPVKSGLKVNGRLRDTNEQQWGFRTIEVVNEPDSLGQSFYVKVNGIPTFMRGTNYIPNDSFLGHMTDSVYEANFENAIASNMNMIRIWGGGVYEDDRFYQLADRNGMLVWQDFMFACTMYPSDSAFLANVAREAEYNIRRLRNHPSVALWCGNNEIKMGWENWGWQQTYNYSEADQRELSDGYNKLFNQLLPGKVRELDPQRFYYDSSPISNWGKIEDFNLADNHYWGVWWGKHAFERFNEFVPRFMSEFGFQSFPGMETIKQFSDEKDWDIDSPVMRSHQKSSIGNVTIKEYMQRDYRMPSTFEDFVYLNQVMQAEGMRIAFEAHRRHKPFCMGTLYWQFNDVWPVVSWSGIDYYGRWKAMQYFVKKAFEPVITSAVAENGELKIHVISDKIEPVSVESTVRLMRLDGSIVWEQTQPLTLEANENRQILKQPLAAFIKNEDKNNLVLVMNTRCDGHDTETTFLFGRVKDLNLQAVQPEIRVTENGNQAEVFIKSPVFAKNVQLASEGIAGRWSDNYFDLIPGKEYRVTFTATGRLSGFAEKLSVKSIRNTY